MPTRPGVIVVTSTWDGLGLAMLMERQGSDVLVAYDFEGLKDKDLEAAKRCGEGLIERMPLEQARKLYQGGSSIWLFDNNSFPEQADALRKAGDQVIGTGALSAKMEKDRDHAAKVAKDVGFSLSDTQEFSDIGKAIAYLEEHEETAYVCKTQGGDADLTFVPQPADEASVANAELRGYLQALEGAKDRPKKFIVQERVLGVEANVDLWVHRGKPLVAFVDLEAKRRLNGDLGELVGCGFDYLFQVPITSPIVRRTAGRYLGMPELRGYTGSIDANVMIVGEKYYFLENCDRLGYNAAPTLFYGLARAEGERIIGSWLSGKPLGNLFSKGYAASLTMLASEHQPDFPVLVPREVQDHFCPYALHAATKTGEMAMVGGGKSWYAVGCVVAEAAAARDAGRKTLEIADKIAFPNKGHRTDIDETEPDTLPLARLNALRKMGLLAAPTLATRNST